MVSLVILLERLKSDYELVMLKILMLKKSLDESSTIPELIMPQHNEMISLVILLKRLKSDHELAMPKDINAEKELR